MAARFASLKAQQLPSHPCLSAGISSTIRINLQERQGHRASLRGYKKEPRPLRKVFLRRKFLELALKTDDEEIPKTTGSAPKLCGRLFYRNCHKKTGKKIHFLSRFLAISGGEAGIRTLGTLAGTRALQARLINRSSTSPQNYFALQNNFAEHWNIRTFEH